MSKWKYGVLFFILGTVGCAEKVEPLPAPEIVLEKPRIPWPQPVTPVRVGSFKFENFKGKVWAMLDYPDYIKFSKGQINKERFVRDLISMVCYYQYDEKRCEHVVKK